MITVLLRVFNNNEYTDLELVQMDVVPHTDEYIRYNGELYIISSVIYDLSTKNIILTLYEACED